MHKHRAGRNTRWFAPEGLRELGPTEKVGTEQTAYVKLEGLGKIPFSNIRRPRPLMDIEPKQQPARDEVGFCFIFDSTESDGSHATPSTCCAVPCLAICGLLRTC